MTSTWKTKKLGEICNIKTGKKDVNQGNPNGRYPFFTCAKEHTYSDNYSFDLEALLVAGNGDVGNVSYYNGKFEAYQRTYILSNFKEISPQFLFLFLNGFLKNTVSQQKLGNTMPYIKMGILTNFNVPIPPLTYQDRIVKLLNNVLGNIDEVQKNTEKELQNSIKIFDSYLQKVFSNPKKDWIRKKLGEIATFRNGLNFTKGSRGEKINIVGVKDFQKNFWVPLELLDSVIINGRLNETDLLKENDILTVRSNGNPELIGRMMITGKVEKTVSHSGFTIRIRLNVDDVYPQYLCYLLKSQTLKKELIESGNGINIKSLNQSVLSSLSITYPKSILEQKLIVSKLDSLSKKSDKLVAIYQQKLIALDELKKSILGKAFSGEL